jgi:hypothetical protein
MTARELILMLATCDLDAEVEVEKLFHETVTSELRAVHSFKGRIILKDHYVRLAEPARFMAHNGEEFDIPVLPERMLR